MITFYTIAEYAKKKKITRVRVWQMIKEKKILSVQVAPKLHLIIK